MVERNVALVVLRGLLPVRLEYDVRARHDHIWGLNEALASRK